MNIRKVFAVTLVLGLASCDTILSKAITCEHANNPLFKFLFDEAPSPIVAPNLHQHRAVEPAIKPIESNIPSKPSKAQAQDHPHQGATYQPQKPVITESNHVHNSNNAPGARSTRTTLWQQNNRNHQTSESYDKNSCVHQVQKWVDSKGKKHETDQWNDQAENVHQCYIFQDEDGCVHEVVQVTDANGRVTAEHFKKDKAGKITKVDKGQVGKAAVSQQKPSKAPIIPQEKGVLHAPNCPSVNKLK